MQSIKYHIAVFLFITFVFAGCDGRQQSDEMTGGVALPTPGIPMPTAEMLAALGPENNVAIQRLLPDAILVVAGKPKQFLASPASDGVEWFARHSIADFLQLGFLNIDPSDIEFFVQSNSIPFPVQVRMPHPQNPTQTVIEIIPIARRATVITFAEPFDLAELLGIDEFDPAILEPLRRTEGRNEFFDLTPPHENLPRRIALGLLDERTIVFALGTEMDIRAVFSDAIPENAVLTRLRHTPVDTNDLTAITSLEGIPVSQEDLYHLMQMEGRALGIPPAFLSLVSQHFRALTLSLNVSAALGQPIVSIDVEGRDEESTEVIGSTIRGEIISALVTLTMMDEAMQEQLPIPPDVATALLNAMVINTGGRRVNITLNNFETLIPFVADWMRNRQTMMQAEELEWQREQLFRWRVEQLRELAEISTFFYMEHGRFPADILDAQGNPLLSWRVELLPMMGPPGEHLHSLFKLDEPWDSETNLALKRSSPPPPIFHPMASDIEPTKTVIRFFDSPGTPFSNRDLRVENLERPRSTLKYFIVSPEYAVEWTKPESLVFDIDNLAEILGEFPLGVTFSRQVVPIPVPRDSNPDDELQKRFVEALFKGLPLPQREESP